MDLENQVWKMMWLRLQTEMKMETDWYVCVGVCVCRFQLIKDV